MATPPKTDTYQHEQPLRGIRKMPLDLWQAFDTAAKTAGTDRSTLVVQFAAWYTRQPGAHLPQPPAIPAPGD